MENETEKKLYEIINQIPVTENNRKQIIEIKMAIQMGEYKEALAKLKELNKKHSEEETDESEIIEESEEGLFPAKLKIQS